MVTSHTSKWMLIKKLIRRGGLYIHEVDLKLSTFSNMPVSRQAGGVRCIDRVKFGFLIGAAVGASVGAMYGAYGGIRYGLRGRELLRGLGSAIMQSGGTFGVFMAIGSAIRCWAADWPKKNHFTLYKLFNIHSCNLTNQNTDSNIMYEYASMQQLFSSTHPVVRGWVGTWQWPHQASEYPPFSSSYSLLCPIWWTPTCWTSWSRMGKG